MLRHFRLVLLLAFCVISATLAAQTAIPTSGQPVPSLAQLDTIMEQYMTQYNSPGANLSVSVDGRLVFARGYGYANTSTGEFVQPDSRMRLASNSKIITTVGILKLIEQGKLTLATKPFVSILNDLQPPPGTTMDPRVLNITVQNLLEHKAGYDDGSGYPNDPVNDYPTNRAAANAAGLSGMECTPKALISYELGVALQHDPGTTYAYSNLGYLTLGYIIERVTGVPYATWIEQNIFPLANMTQTLPAGNLPGDKLPYEVAYYGYPGELTGPSMIPPVGVQVPYEYGGYDLVLELANGGWTSTPMDLLRFWDTLNGQYSYNILSGPQSSRDGDVPPLGQGYYYTFYGSLPGTNSLVHLNTSSQVVGRVVYSAIFNTRDPSLVQPEEDADNAIQAYVQTVKSWPTGDLFPTYASSGTACAFTLQTATATAPINGSTGSANLTDANYCAWSAATSATWIHLTAAGPFSTTGSAAYTVDANTGAPRTGTIILGGQTFTVSQVGTTTPTTLTLSGTGTTVGTTETVTLKAVLSPYNQSGNSTDGEIITFQDGGNNAVLGTAKLTGGVATLTATVPTPQINSFAASYPGDTYFSSSFSANLAITPTSTSATVSPASLTFPSTPTGVVSASQTSTFTNTGTTALSINLILLQGQFKQTNNCGGSVAAGAVCTFTITYNPTSTGPATGSIDVSDNAGDQIISLSGTATAAAPVVTLSASSLTFASTPVNTSAPVQMVTVTNTGNAPLTISNIAAISGANQFTQTNNCTSAAIAVNSSCTINVTFSPTSTGALTASVTLTDNATPTSQTIALSGTGSAAPAGVATFSPASLTFGNTQVGTTSASMTTTLTNTGNAALTVGTVIGVMGDFSVPGSTCGGSLAVNASCSYTVVFAPTATGARTGSFNLTTSIGNQSFPLTGSGTAYPVPTVSLTATPSTLTYGQALTLSASAANVPAGANYTYSILDGTTVISTALSPSSTYSYTVATPMAGSHSYTAVLTSSNTATYPTATSNAVPVTIAKAGTTSNFAMPAAITYGTPLSATQLAATSTTPGTFTYTPPAGTFLNAGSQALSATLTPTDATDYSTSNAATTITVNKAGLIATAANASRPYGAVNPSLTGTVSGVVNADAITATYSSTAALTMAAGTTAPITPVLVDPGNRLVNYNVTVNPGTLTVTQAGTNAALTGPASTPAGTAVTLTATVSAQTSGTPTGTVAVAAGAVPVGTATLVNGVATFTYTPPTGSTTLTLTYSGDSNFTASMGSLIVTTGLPDFSLSATPTSASVPAGTSAVYTLTNAGINGFSQTIFFSCTGLPANAACNFAPAIVAAGQSTQLTITTNSGMTALNPQTGPGMNAGRGVAATFLASSLVFHSFAVAAWSCAAPCSGCFCSPAWRRR